MNSFQKWARKFASQYGFTVTERGNWVELHRHGATIVCMSMGGVRAACSE